MALKADGPTEGAEAASATRARRALHSLSFFMADLQAGIGPFLGVFLRQRGWAIGPIGTVMTAGGVAGMVFTAPAGAFIDHTTRKRLVVVVTGICTVAASLLNLLSQSGLVVTASQVATAIAGAAIARCHGHDAGHRPATRVQRAERPQPGVQSCGQHDRRGDCRTGLATGWGCPRSSGFRPRSACSRSSRCC